MHMSVKENINCALAFQMAARLVLEYREAAARYKESTSIGEYFSKVNICCLNLFFFCYLLIRMLE